MIKEKFELNNKIAVITGASKGIGKAMAQGLAEFGATVIVSSRKQEAVDEVAKEFTELGLKADSFECHVAKHDQREKLIEKVIEKYGRIDILVNNAGIVKPCNPENQTTEEYRFTMSVHMDSTFFGCKYVIPVMAKTGGGSIVNMCSIASVQGESYVAAYCAAKGAIEAYSRAVAVHCGLAKNGVRCNTIHPSGIATPMVASVPALMEEKFGASPVVQEAPVESNKVGEPLDIANAALYLASDESKFVNGAQIRVDNAMSVVSGNMPE